MPTTQLVSSEKPIGQETGHFGMYAVPNSHDILLQPKEVLIVGYAADLIKKKVKNNISIRAKKEQDDYWVS